MFIIFIAMTYTFWNHDTEYRIPLQWVIYDSQIPRRHADTCTIIENLRTGSLEGQKIYFGVYMAAPRTESWKLRLRVRKNSIIWQWDVFGAFRILSPLSTKELVLFFLKGGVFVHSKRNAAIAFGNMSGGGLID